MNGKPQFVQDALFIAPLVSQCDFTHLQFKCGASCVSSDDHSWRRRARTSDTGMGDPQCASGSDVSVRQSARIASHIPSTCIGKVSLPCAF